MSCALVTKSYGELCAYECVGDNDHVCLITWQCLFYCVVIWYKDVRLVIDFDSRSSRRSVTKQYTVMFHDWEANCRSTVALATHQYEQVRSRGLWKGNDHPAYPAAEVWHVLPSLFGNDLVRVKVLFICSKVNKYVNERCCNI